MKLTKKAIRRIKDRGISLKLALALNFSEQWVLNLIEANKPNGPLTTIGVLRVIREETGLPDSELLEEEEPVKA